jgi:GNAT superfamily N-acetyltransferase
MERYFAVESDAGELAGCGGWSKRRTLFGSDHAAVREDDCWTRGSTPPRSALFFVHPDFARKGIGSKLLEACEQAAYDAGFRRFEMGSTLTGVNLYPPARI